MKKNLFFGILLLISVNAFAQKKAYKAAIEENSIVTYKIFVEKYPNSKYIDEIVLRLEDLEIIAAKEKNEVDAYDEFLKKYPGSRYKSEIEARIEDIYFNETKRENTVDAYDEFLKKYSNSRHKPEINAQIEDILFSKAKRENTTGAYDEFLKKYPNSRHKPEINAQIEDILFSKAKRENTIGAYDEFLKKYPESKYKPEINAQIEGVLFKEAQGKSTVEAYDEFLKKYPDSRYRTEVQANKILLLMTRETPRIETLDSIQNNDIDIIINAFLQRKTRLSASAIFNKISARSFEAKFIGVYLINTVQLANLWIYEFAGSSKDTEKIKRTKGEFIQTHENLLLYLEFFSKVLEENRKYDAAVENLLNILIFKESVLLAAAKKYESAEAISYLEKFLPNAAEKFFSKFNLGKK